MTDAWTGLGTDQHDGRDHTGVPGVGGGGGGGLAGLRGDYFDAYAGAPFPLDGTPVAFDPADSGPIGPGTAGLAFGADHTMLTLPVNSLWLAQFTLYFDLPAALADGDIVEVQVRSGAFGNTGIPSVFLTGRAADVSVTAGVVGFGNTGSAESTLEVLHLQVVGTPPVGLTLSGVDLYAVRLDSATGAQGPQGDPGDITNPPGDVTWGTTGTGPVVPSPSGAKSFRLVVTDEDGTLGTVEVV